MLVSWLCSGCAKTISPSDKCQSVHEKYLYSTLETYEKHLHTDIHWWQTINDSLLHTIIQHGLDHSYDQKIAKLTYEQAKNAYDLQMASQQLNVSASSSYVSDHANKTDVKNLDYHQYTLTSNFQVDLWGKNRYALKGKLAAIYAAEMQLLQSKNVLVSSIIQSYVTLRSLQSKVSLEKQRIQLIRQQLILEQERKTRGLSGTTEMDQLNMKLAEMCSHLNSLESLRNVTAYTLANLSGYDVVQAEEWMKKDAPVPVRPQQKLLSHKLDIIRNRPDVLYFEYSYLESKMIHQSNVRSFYPQLTLGNVLNLLFVKSTTGTPWSLSAQFLQSYLNPNYIKKSIMAARLQEDIKYNLWMDAVTNAVTDIHIQLARYQSSCDQVEHAVMALKAASNQFKTKQELYKHGIISEMDRMSAQWALIENKHGLTDAYLQSYIDMVKVYQSAGLY